MADPTVEREAESSRVQELVRRCEGSRNQRRVYCDTLRTWYERGTDGGPRARSNKIASHIDRLSSYLYAPASTRFGVHLPPSVREPWLPAADVLKDEFRSVWQDSGADLTAARLLEWALVYGATVGKIQADPHTGFRLGYIQPWDFGMSREGVPDLDEQDVVAHWYTLSIPQIERWVQGHPREEAILAIAREHESHNQAAGRPRQMLQVTASGTYPGGTITGGFPGEPPEDTGEPGAIEDEPVVLFVDCWERRLFKRRDYRGKKAALFEDWLVTTMIATANQIVTQRRNPDLPHTKTSHDVTLLGELPFGLMVPRPLPDYAWGRSELLQLLGLQLWRESHVGQMGKVLERQLRPSNFFSGVADVEEAERALDTPGGAYASPEPNAKMQSIIPQVTPEAINMIDRIDADFAESSGIPKMLETAQAAGGVRTMGQERLLAGIAGGRIRKAACFVEEGIGVFATKGFHLLQRTDPHGYPLPKGGQFLLAQLPAGLTIRVDAHSSSPVFQEQTQEKAAILLKAGAIGAEDLVELIDPPGREELKPRAREREEAKAQASQEFIKAKEASLLRGRAGK